MWRSIIVHDGERLSLDRNSLVVEKGSKEIKIPIDDLYCLVIDQYRTMITIPVLERLTSKNVAIVICNDKHLPTCNVLPINNNYHSYKVFKKQIGWNKQWKNELWKRVIVSKIKNQANVLLNAKSNNVVVTRLYELSEEVVEGDLGNREAIAAKIFFRNLYGSDFIRFEDDAINAALNYGYAIIRSCVATALISCGFNLCVGIHHISETNAYNLADDMMEPFRALVDTFVDENHLDLTYPLCKENKVGLLNILNEDVIVDDKKTKVRYAIVEMAKSLVTCTEKGDTKFIKLPTVICLQEE